MRYSIVICLLFLSVSTRLGLGSEDLEDLTFEDEELNSTEEKDGLGGRRPSQQQHLPTTDEEKKEFLKRVMSLAMQQPGAKSRLGQVLPILRQMSAPQRLALASLVMSQVLADPNDPGPPPELPASSENATSQLMLPISMDIASMFRGLGREQPQAASARSSPTFLEPQAFQSGRPRPPLGLRPPLRRQTVSGINRRNANVQIERGGGGRPRPGGGRPLRRPIGAKQQTCNRLSNNVCVETNDYPEEAIVATILSDEHPERFKQFLSEPPLEGEFEAELLRRKSEETEGGGGGGKGHMCSSKVELARPKKARATSGQWKYIVNTKDYTQTLRLEICTRPQSRCNYLPEGVDSQCLQIYNYHRLLTWDETAGLTMDVFKVMVPTCCSCRVLGFNGVPFLASSPAGGAGGERTSVRPDLDTNLVSVGEESPQPSQVHLRPSLQPHKPVRGYVPPKRESGRWPTIQHRGPPLPLEAEAAERPPQPPPRYPPLDNSLRRTTKNSTIDRIRFKASPNSRHPALPADSLAADSGAGGVPATASGSSSGVGRPSVGGGSSGGGVPSSLSPPRRINYSYHPIIDYFRGAEGGGAGGPSSSGGGSLPPHLSRATPEARLGQDWTPIAP